MADQLGAAAPQTGHHHASMRKGTHSCVECRRRKVRCLFSPDDQTSCITCRKKGKICQEQRREHFPPAGGKKTSLKDRVAKLEALLKSSAIEIDEDSPENESNTTRSDILSNHEQTPEYGSRGSAPPTRDGERSAAYDAEGFRSQDADSPSDDEEDYDPDPLVSLFNNGVWQSQEPKGGIKIVDTYQLNVDHRIAAKKNFVLTALRSTLISPYLLRDVLNASSGWWQGWRPLGPWPVEYTTAAAFTTLQDFLLFAYNAENPAVVGLAVLCIAECIRKLTMPMHEALIRQLPRPPQELFQILFERVDRLINSDVDFSNSKEGIDCLMMSAKVFQGIGLPKRSWLLMHRAIIYGTFLGIHRNQLQPGETKEDRHVRQNAWDSLCQTDLFLSMTLGLPYATAGRNIPLSYYGEAGSPMWFQRRCMDAATEMIDRNQSGRMTDEKVTQSITMILDEAIAHMAPEFWEAPQILKSGTGNRRQALEWTTKQMFYWVIRIFVHLPLSIQSLEQPHLEGHRLACQAGCRGMLTVFQVMRSDPRADIANLIDYQAFISCSMLLLGLLGYGASPRAYVQVDHNPDRELVASTLQILHATSSRGNNNVAAEAVEGLESLFRLTDPATHHAAMNMDFKDLKTKIKIPYIGTISVAPGEQLQRAHSNSPEPFPQLPVFTFVHPELTASPPQAYQSVGTMAAAASMAPAQAPVTTGADMMEAEFHSINFEFDNLMAMNPGDWSWISSEVAPEQYY